MYQCRFIKQDHSTELINLYHLARTALADKPVNERQKHGRMIWASEQLAKKYGYKMTGVYKDLYYLLD